MRKYRALAAALLTAVPISMLACGDDADDSPPGTGGTSGDAGDGGTAGDRGGTGQGGSRGGTGGTSSGAGGEGASGAGGGDTGGTSTGGTDSTGGTGGTGGPTGCDLSGDGKDHATVPADIMDEVTLTSDTVWDLEAFVKVHDGGVLNIEPCTRIEGSPAPSPGVLAVLRGGQINAVGTADEPILFTSTSPAGARAAGQWGGVVLLGRAPITAANDAKVFEGLTDADFTYGGDAADDSSGTMQYVRIEFAGWNITPDKEINGLSMAAVGSGTTLDHIMVTNIKDDCFEWWGGAVEANYLICNNPGDDMFDTDEGYTASNSYWFGRRTTAGVVSSTDPSGFEWDGTEGGADLTPRTHPTVSNVTLCGTGVAFSPGGASPEFGMVLRERALGTFDNVAILGFEYGIDTRTNTNMAGDTIGADDFSMDNSLFWSLTNTVSAADTSNNDNSYDDDVFVADGTNNDPNADPPPFTLEECQTAGELPAAVKDSDVGAFAGDAEWMNGLWVDFADE